VVALGLGDGRLTARTLAATVRRLVAGPSAGEQVL